MRPLIIPLLAFFLSSCADKKKNPQFESLNNFQIADGFEISLFASEPLISDPVAMEVDENGDVYVVEMHGYPLDKSGSGKIKQLKDTSGDGLPDIAVVFAEGLRLPSGIMRWKKGIIVTDVPDVLYLEDSNGDGKADKREIMLTGMALSNPQHNGNTPLYGPDNWIYIGHESSITPVVYTKEFGDKGSLIRFPSIPDGPTLPLNANGRNIRFNPDKKLLEMCSGETQYGHTFDNRGHHFFTANADHIFHEGIAARYLEKNPILRIADATENIPDHGDAARIFPITKNPEHQLLTDVGVITSSCGITWYNGGLFPDSFNNVTFIAEPVHNIVHADRVTDNGASFTASRVYQKKEFLASEDPWFRPVQFYIGPDGALYVIDYYRQYIEHPEWMSEEVANSGALYNGSDKGRIYRIAPKGSKGPDWLNRIDLGNAEILKLVSELENKNGWWRRQAQRMLVDRKDVKSIPLIERVIEESSDPNAIIQALWTLEGMDASNTSLLKFALLHHEPGVRENAIRISEHHLSDTSLTSALRMLRDDTDPKVSYQLLCTSALMEGEDLAGLRSHILIKHIKDKWFGIAALASSPGKELALMEQMIRPGSITDFSASNDFLSDCSAIITMRQDKNEIKQLVAIYSNKNLDASLRTAILKGIHSGSRLVDLNKDIKVLVVNSVKPLVTPDTDSSLRENAVSVWLRLSGPSVLPDKIIAAIPDDSQPAPFRKNCIQLSALSSVKVNPAMLLSLISPQQSELVQEAAVKTYLKTSRTEAGNMLFKRWQSLTPSIRTAVLEECMRDNITMNALMNAVGTQLVQPASIPWPMQVSLMNNDNLDIRKKARAILGAGLEDRNEVLKKYSDALTLKGDITKGETVFINNCGVCHQLDNKNGKAFGPDLTSIRNREAIFILADIIQPARSIADGYEWWNIVLRSGNKKSGIISAETSSGITIKDPSLNETIIPRSEIISLTTSNQSAMPAGLEQNISVQQMADLLAYLKK
jgi:putative membrane-bound dehydrogenase-like protein